MNMFSRTKNLKEVYVTLKNMSLIDIPPHGTPIFIKIKQDRRQYTTKSVNIINNTATWIELAKIKCMIASVTTDKHPNPLRLSFRFEDASGKDFTRYGIAEIDCTTVFHEKVHNVEILLTNCDYNTKFRCTIDVNTSASSQPNSLDNFTVPKLNSISDFPSITTTNISERSVGALVTNARTGGTTVSFQAPKQPYELAPVPISEKRYQELEAQVDDILSKIIIDSAQM